MGYSDEMSDKYESDPLNSAAHVVEITDRERTDAK